MRLNLAGDIKVGSEQVIEVRLAGKLVWEKFTAVPPEFEIFDGQRTEQALVTLIWDIESEVELTGLAYQINDGQWIDIEPIEKTGSIDTEALQPGEVSILRMRAINVAGETLSGSLSFFIQGDTLVFFEDFEGQPVNESWKDSFNGNPIAHQSTVTVREGQDFEGKGLQLKYLSFDAGGTYNGSQRMEHPYRHFQIPEHNAYEMSVDWYFENVFDFNTIGQDEVEIRRRMAEYGNMTPSEIDQTISDWATKDNNPINPAYAATGFPFITGKMHGFISPIDGPRDTPAGGNAPRADRWSVRCIWLKDENSHPQKSGGLHVAGISPDMGPTLALYIYGQDRAAGEFGAQIPMRNFAGLEKQRWYTIKLFVQVNDPGVANGIADLRVYDKATGNQLGSVYADDLLLRGNVQQSEALIHRLFFSTFYGGGNIRYSAKINPAWADLPEIGTNNGTYARNDNYAVHRQLALPPLVVNRFQAAPNNATRITVNHVHGLSLVEGFEYKLQGGTAGEYNDSQWQTVTDFEKHNTAAHLIIPNTVGVDYIWVRAIIGGRGSARVQVDLTNVNRPPVILSTNYIYNRQSEVLQVNYAVDSYYQANIRFRVNHGTWQTGGNDLSGDIFIPISSSDYSGQVVIELNAENLYGVSDTDSYSLFISEENVEYYEDFEGIQHEVDQPWRDPNNNNPISGGNITVRDGQDFYGKGVQIKYLSFTAGGTLPGSQRLEHPFQHFQLPEHKAYELSVDWFFERTWDFNTIAHDVDEMKRRLQTYGLHVAWNGIQAGTPYSSSQANSYIAQFSDSINTDYISTGYPYNTGKMHGLISRHDGTPPAGGQPPSPDEWSVRCIWLKDENSHPQMSGGLHVAGISPDMGPTLALYIYGQDRVAGEFGAQIPMRNFSGLEKQRWYTIKLFVQVNDPNVPNGIAELRVYDKASGLLLGSVEATDLRLRGNVSENTGLAHRIMFSTFYGGGNLRYGAKLDPAWESNGWVNVNNGTHARNDNFIAKRVTPLDAVVIEDHGFDDFGGRTYNNAFYADISHVLGAHNFESFEALIDGQWEPLSVRQSEGTFRLRMPAAETAYTFIIRGKMNGRNSARSISQTMEVPVLPATVEFTVVNTTPTEISLAYTIESTTPITQRRWRVNGGAWQALTSNTGTLTFTHTGELTDTSVLFEVEITNNAGAIIRSRYTNLTGYDFLDPGIQDVIVEADRVRVIWYGYAWSDQKIFPPVLNARYEIRKRQSDGSWNLIQPWTDIETDYPVPPGETRELILTGLETGVEHDVRLLVYNAKGTNGASTVRAFTPGMGIGVPLTPTIESVVADDGALIVHGYMEEPEEVKSPPEIPTVVQVEAKREELVLHGHNNGDGGSPIIRLEYGFNNGSFQGWYSASGFPISISGIDPVEYTILVRAVNAVGVSDAYEVQGTPLPPVPGEEDWPLYTESMNEPLSWNPVKEVEMTDHAGLAGIRCIGTGNHPSSNPNDWTLFKDGHPEWDCLDLVNPYMLTERPKTSHPSRNEFPKFWKVKGGVGALWSAAYDSNHQPTGTLGRAARTKIIGEVWGHSHNQLRRVINKPLPWAGDHRRSSPTLHYDPDNGRYVSFFGEKDSGGTWEPDGIRCIGSCWTTTPHDRESWIYKEDYPVLTHSMVRALYPELMQPQVSGNNFNWARMYPRLSFYHEGKHYLYFDAAIWTRSSTGNDYENIDMILATTDYTDHTKWERVDQMDWNLIQKRRDDVPDGATNPSKKFWTRNSSWIRGMKSLTYYDGYYYTTSGANAGLNGGRGIAIYKATSPFGPWQPHGTGNVPLIETPYGVGTHNQSALILYRDVWFLFGSIRNDGVDPNESPLSTKYSDAYVDRAYRVIFGGYYDPYGKINDILNSG